MTNDTSFRQLLVPVDFSTASNDAVNMAMKIASPFGADVELLHVWAPIPGLSSGLGIDVLQTLATTAAENMKEMVDAVVIPSGVSVTTRVVQGESRRLIVDMSEFVDLIIMGTHGRTGLDRMLLGSTAEHVVRHAACPVLTVRNSDVSAELERSGVARAKVIRAMVEDGAQLRAVVAALIDTGISSDAISVVMSEDAKDADFAELDAHKGRAGAATGGIMAGTVGGVLGGLAGIGAVVTTGGLALFVLGPALGLAAVGGAVGGLLGRTIPDDRAAILKAQLASGSRLVAVHVERASQHEAVIAMLKAHDAEVLDS